MKCSSSSRYAECRESLEGIEAAYRRTQQAAEKYGFTFESPFFDATFFTELDKAGWVYTGEVGEHIPDAVDSPEHLPYEGIRPELRITAALWNTAQRAKEAGVYNSSRRGSLFRLYFASQLAEAGFRYRPAGKTR